MRRGSHAGTSAPGDRKAFGIDDLLPLGTPSGILSHLHHKGAKEQTRWNRKSSGPAVMSSVDVREADAVPTCPS